MGIYGAYHKDDRIRLNSSSGGVFSALASDVLKQGGVVFGAELKSNSDGHFYCQHTECRKEEDLVRLCGTKYLVSDVGPCFPKIKSLLNEGYHVMFVGTPCQVAGLACYLGRRYPNLLLVDLICHGVPSDRILDKVIAETKCTENDRVTAIRFRDKKTGWASYSFSIETDKTSFSWIGNQSKFMKLFLSDMFLRPSCYSCTFKGENRYSDLTLGDFWGAENYVEITPEDLKKGLSVIAVHTQQGFEAMKHTSETLFFTEIDAHYFDESNIMYRQSTQKPFGVHRYQRKLEKESIDEILLRLEKEKKLRKIVAKVQNRLKKLKTDKAVDNQLSLPTKDGCYSCSACAAACPVGAIEMKKNQEGFRYPFVDRSMCIDCHLCVKVCPAVGFKGTSVLKYEDSAATEV